MAEDLCRKSAIIETYVMDSRIGENCSLQEGASLEATRNLRLKEKGGVDAERKGDVACLISAWLSFCEGLLVPSLDCIL